jgi:phospholipid/cholesterol/gamma-HCH transport system substrate-binding protein
MVGPMDQSRSSNNPSVTAIALPNRRFTIEFFVGLFTMVSLAFGGWLAVGLGDLRIGITSDYEIFAQFDNISGLKKGASVEIAGVPIGEVSDIALKDPAATVTLRIAKSIQIRDDDIISIRTKGIIGDRYVKVSRGASDITIPPGGTTNETESVVDIEDIIGKLVHSLGSDKEKDETEGEKDSSGKK